MRTLLILLAALGLSKGASVSPECDASLKSATTANAFELFRGSGACFQSAREPEASFLLVIGQIRAMADIGLLKPSGKEDEDEAAELYGYLYFKAGGPGSIAIYRDPAASGRLFEMIRRWEPELPADYDPGWAYRRQPDSAKYFEALEYDREVRLIQLAHYTSILRDDAYYAAHLEHEEILKRNSGTLVVGTPDYLRSVELQAIMSAAAAGMPEPKFPKPPKFEFVPDPEAEFRQIYAGFNGLPGTESAVVWTRREATESWLADALQEKELDGLLDQVDFDHEMLVVHSVGRRHNVTGALHVVDVDVRDDSSVSISVQIGVNEPGCKWPDADAFPFVIAVTRKPSERGYLGSHFQGNFGDGCKPPRSGRPTQERGKGEP